MFDNTGISIIQQLKTILIDNECILKNPSCVELGCSPEKMSVKIRRDAFGSINLSKSSSQKFLHNGEDCSQLKVNYNDQSDSYEFEIPFGSCGMAAEMAEEKITFSHQINPKSEISDQAGILNDLLLGFNRAQIIIIFY